MTADIDGKDKKQQHIFLRVCVVFILSFSISVLVSTYMHAQMLMQTIARVSQVACGQAAQTIVEGLSYGKEISNYSGIDTLLENSVALCPELKNVYICDTNGMIWGSYIKMMDNTVVMNKGLMSSEEARIHTKFADRELHFLQPLLVNGKTAGYIGAVTDIRFVMGPYRRGIPKKLGFALLHEVCGAIVVYLLWLCTKISQKSVCMLTAALCVISIGWLHLDTQRYLLDTELARQAQVMVATIDADATRLTKNGIDIGSTVGFIDYLEEKLDSQDIMATLELENKLNGQHYSASNTLGMTTAYIKEYTESQFFNISVGISPDIYDFYKKEAIIVWVIILAVIEVIIITLLYMIKKKTDNSDEH